MSINTPEHSIIHNTYVRLDGLDEAFAMPEGQILGEDHDLFLHGREVDIRMHDDGLVNGIFGRLVPVSLDSTKYGNHSYSFMRIRTSSEVINLLGNLDVYYQILRRVDALNYEPAHDLCDVFANPGNYICRAVIPPILQDPFLRVAILTLDGRLEGDIIVEYGIDDELTHLTGPERVHSTAFNYEPFVNMKGEEGWLCVGEDYNALI